IFNSDSGEWVEKTSNHGVNSEFPDAWSESRVVAEIYNAFLNRAPDPELAANGWLGTATTGMPIAGYLNGTFPPHDEAPFAHVPSAFPLYTPTEATDDSATVDCPDAVQEPADGVADNVANPGAVVALQNLRSVLPLQVWLQNQMAMQCHGCGLPGGNVAVSE